MCGILAQVSKRNKPVNQAILEAFNRQIGRGTQGFGFAFEDENGRVATRFHTQKEGILSQLAQCRSTAMIFHHRIPTSTPNVFESCHPFKVSVGNKSLYTIHNGYISNDDELKEEHEKLGYTYRSQSQTGKFNDSEALAHELALKILDGKELMGARGGVAFIALETDGNDAPVAIYFGRNSSSPLKLRVSRKSIVIGSETPGDIVPPGYLNRLDLDTYEIETTPMSIAQYSYSAHSHGQTTFKGTQYLGAGYDDDDMYGGYDGYDWRDGDYPLIGYSSVNRTTHPIVIKDLLPPRASAVRIKPPYADSELSYFMNDSELQLEIDATGDIIMALECQLDDQPELQEELGRWHTYYEQLTEEHSYRETHTIIATVEDKNHIRLEDKAWQGALPWAQP